MSQEPYYSDETEIDLREIFQNIWKARVVIIIVTLAAMLVVFSISAWFIPPKYQTTAYLFIGQPVVDIGQSGNNNASTITGFTISPTLPDIKAVVKLATSPKLLNNTINDPKVVSAFGKNTILIGTLSENVTAVDVGKDQLSLQVTDTDPQRAVLLANTLALEVEKTVNDTYGFGTISETLNTQVLQSQKGYEQAQAAIEVALSKSPNAALTAQMNRKKADLADVLNSISRTTSGLDDLQFFEKGLNGIAGETPLSLGDVLVLTTIQERSLTASSDTENNNFSIQVDGANNSSATAALALANTRQSSPVVGVSNFNIQIDSAALANFTVSKALTATSQLRAALQIQLTQLQSKKSRLEQEIPLLQRDQENAQAQLTQLTSKRDQADQLHNALLQQQQLIATVLAQNAKVANVSVAAVRPDKALSSKALTNTATAGIIAIILCCGWVLLQAWWRQKPE